MHYMYRWQGLEQQDPLATAWLSELTAAVTSIISLMLCSVVFCSKYSRISAETVFHLRAYSDTASTNENVAFAWRHIKHINVKISRPKRTDLQPYWALCRSVTDTEWYDSVSLYNALSRWKTNDKIGQFCQPILLDDKKSANFCMLHDRFCRLILSADIIGR